MGRFNENHGMYQTGPGTSQVKVDPVTGGMRAIKYGLTRDYVRRPTVVLADGEVLTPSGKVSKNSSGYSLMK